MLIIIPQAISALASLISLVMFIIVLIKLFKEKGLLHVILGFFCGIYPFIWGWAEHRKLDLTKKMAIWSVCTVIPFICMGATMAIVGQTLIFNMMSGMQEAGEMVQSVQKHTPPMIPRKPVAAKDPKKVADPFKQSVALWKDGKYKNPQKAVAYLKHVVDKNPNNAVPYNNRGVAYLDLNQFQQALKDFNKAIAINKAYAMAYNNRGSTHYAMENYQVALADYEQSIRLNPKHAHTYFNRGLAYYQLKKTDLACKDFEKACEMGDCDGTNWARREGLCQ